MMGNPTDGDKFIAECEYTCGFSYGPDTHTEVWQRATAHEKDCLYGGPAIRNVNTSSAPWWVNDPFLDENIGYTPPTHVGTPRKEN